MPFASASCAGPGERTSTAIGIRLDSNCPGQLGAKSSPLGTLNASRILASMVRVAAADHASSSPSFPNASNSGANSCAIYCHVLMHGLCGTAGARLSHFHQSRSPHHYLIRQYSPTPRRTEAEEILRPAFASIPRRRSHSHRTQRNNSHRQGQHTRRNPCPK